jgi:hypothetical protein
MVLQVPRDANSRFREGKNYRAPSGTSLQAPSRDGDYLSVCVNPSRAELLQNLLAI